MNVNSISSGLPSNINQTIQNGQADQIQSDQASPVAKGQSNGAVQNETPASVVNLLKPLLDELSKALEQRNTIIQYLPQDIKNLTQDILQQNLPTTDLVSQGAVALVKNQKDAVEKLQSLVNTLNDAMEVNNQIPKGLLPDMSVILRRFNPELNADSKQPQPVKESDIVLLAKQLLNSAAVETGIKSGIAQLLQQGLAGTDKQQYQQLKNNILLLVKQLVENASPTESKLVPENVQRTWQQAIDSDGKQIFQASTDDKATLPESQSPERLQLTKTADGTQPDKRALLTAAGERQFKELKDATVVLPTGKQEPDQPGIGKQEQKQDSTKLTQQLLQEQSDGTKDGANIVHQSFASIYGKQSQVKENDIMSLFRQLFDSIELGAEGNSDSNQIPSSILPNDEQQPQVNESDLQQLVKQMLDNVLSEKDKYQTIVRQLWQQSPLDDDNLSQKEQAALRQVVDSFRQNAPTLLQQAAGKYNLPELPDLWALLKLQDAAQWTDIPTEKLHSSIQALRELTASMQKSDTFTGEMRNTQNSVSFTTPLYFGEGMPLYPAHIHIYHQHNNEGNKYGQQQPETWLRICMATENVGVVDTVFRLYQENQLNVRVAFPDVEAASAFKDYVPAIHKSLEASSLKLVDISVVNVSGG